MEVLHPTDMCMRGLYMIVKEKRNVDASDLTVKTLR